MKEPKSAVKNTDIASGLRRRVAKERLVLAVAGVTAAAAVVGGIAAASVPASQTVAMRTVAATSPIVPVSSTSGSKGHLCGAVLLVVKRDYDRVPDALRKDVASARHQSSTSAKRTALENVLKKAQSGGYGTDVEAVAKHTKTLAGFKAAWDRLPSALRDDVKKARAASGDERLSDVKAIASKAESGGYGDRVKDAIGKVKTRLDKCIARVQGSGSTSKPTTPSTGTPAPSTPAPSTPAPTSTTGA